MSVPQRVYGLIFNLGNSGQFRFEPLVLGIERIWLRWFRPGVHLSLYLSSEKLEEVSVQLFLNYSSLIRRDGAGVFVQRVWKDKVERIKIH